MEKVDAAWRKETIMEYLVVLATMLMIVGYALIIDRSLGKSEQG